MDFCTDQYLQVHSSDASEEESNADEECDELTHISATQHDGLTHISATQDTVAFHNLNSLHPIAPLEWNGTSPDAVLMHMKSLQDDVVAPHGLKAFYKSYTNWSKMTPDQQDKALA
jgi:hypothetical protein